MLKFKISENSSSKSNLIFIIFVSLFCKLLGPNLGTIIFAIVVSIATANFIKQKNYALSLALTSTLFVGLSPIYLILRGFISQNDLSEWDLQIYGVSFYLMFFLFSGFTRKSKSAHLIQKKNILVNTTIAAYSSLIVGVVFQFFLLSRSAGFGLAWSASGDSKNHAVNGVNIFDIGSLNLLTFMSQPSSTPSFFSLLLAQSGNDPLFFKLNLRALMEAYAFSWIALIGILGVSYAGLFSVVWDKVSKFSKPAPPYLLALASLLSIFSFALGPALFDGFYTAIFGITSVVTLMSWLLETEIRSNHGFNEVLIGFLIFVVSLMAWMFVAPFTIMLFFAGILNVLKSKNFSNRILLITSTAGLGFVLYIVHFTSFGKELLFKAKVALGTTGAVNASQPKTLFLVILLLLALGLKFRQSNENFGNSLIQVSIFQITSISLFKLFSNLSLLEWNYYLIKLQWIMLASLLPLLASVIFFTFLNNFNKLSERYFASMLFFVSMYFVSEISVTSNGILGKIWSGWENPRAVAIEKAISQPIDLSNPTMFFHLGYGGDSKLANFWLTAFSEPVDPLKGWNYTIDTTGDPAQLCEVNAYYPMVTVVTSDLKLEESLLTLCPEQEFQVVLEAPIF